MLDALWQDLRYAVRGLRRSRGFAITVVLTLALGIGANAAMFSVVNAVLLKPLPYPEPKSIVMLVTSTPGTPMGAPVDSAARFDFWRRHANALEQVSAYRVVGVNVTTGEPQQILSLQITADFLRLFGARLVVGRAFTADEHRGIDARSVILSNGFWQRRFAGNPHVFGQTVSLDDVPHVIVGVLNAGFNFETLPYVPTVPAPDVLVPLPQTKAGSPVRYLIGAGRLKSNVSLSEANAQAHLMTQALRRESSNEIGAEDTLRVEPLQNTLVGGARQPLLTLFAAVGFVLLIACANVANLFLIRGSVRRRELAIRTAVGASASRIIRQLMSESLVLSVAAGSLGLLVGLASLRMLLAINPSYLPRIGDNASAVTVDWRVLLFTACVSLLASTVLGLLPALRTGCSTVNSGLTEHRPGAVRDTRRVHGMLIVVEIALALMLVIGAGLLIRTFVAMRTVDPGFEANGVVNVPMVLSGPRFEKTAAVGQVVREGVQRLRSIPGVTAAAAGCCLPMMGRYELPFIIPGRPLTGSEHGLGGWVNVSSGYFDVFKIPLIRGRTFSDVDADGRPGVVVINETMARRFWPNGDPLKDRLLIGQGFAPAEEPARQIVGIVGDVRDGDLTSEPVPMMYVPTAQMTDGSTSLHSRMPMLWFVRTDVGFSSPIASVERELRTASGGIPVATTMIRSMDQVMSESTAASDFQMALMTAFAVAALLLAAVGVYGVTGYSVQRRTREIGIRMALGARPLHVRNMVLAQGMTLTLLGVAFGTASALGVTSLLSGFLFGVTPCDPTVFVLVPILLTAVALVAVWLPARRATQIDPITSLRAE